MKMTGEKTIVILEMPNGCRRNSRISIPHVTPTIVGFEMSGLTTLRPCTAPKTDCAGVNTPSAMTMDTESTPIVFSRFRKNLVFSIVERTVLVDRPSSWVNCRSMRTMVASRGSRFEMFA